MKPSPRIYQALVRHFGNANPTRRPHGTWQENGCGTFADFNDRALTSLRDLGITHLWLTGALKQASQTAHPGHPASPAEICKGRAGSPYAVIDCFDLSPDYATDPSRREEEFLALLERCRTHQLTPLLDLIPNHVSRAHHSARRPELSFGESDHRDCFFHPDNHFYYLPHDAPGGGPPLRLPFPAPQERDRYHQEDHHGRVTGNNAITWSPNPFDWYETVKLNYGHDFTSPHPPHHLPGPDTPPEAVPSLWRHLDEMLSHWQGLGIGGFRVDMAHLVPAPFWHWALRRARQRDPQLFVMGEAYATDPMSVLGSDPFESLIEAGFDALYDDQAYDLCKGLYEGHKWANDLDKITLQDPRQRLGVRYLENHDEVRLANPHEWGGFGPAAGPPAATALFALGTGPILLYNGQEVGEPALGSEGFAGDNGRTSIFDYWSLPEWSKWLSDGQHDGSQATPEQHQLRRAYARLLHLLDEPALREGAHYGLNHANLNNPHFGRLPGESTSGHWLLSFLRHTPEQTLLITINLHPREALPPVEIHLPADALHRAAIPTPSSWRDHLDPTFSLTNPGTCLALGPLQPGQSRFLELQP